MWSRKQAMLREVWCERTPGALRWPELVALLRRALTLAPASATTPTYDATGKRLPAYALPSVHRPPAPSMPRGRSAATATATAYAHPTPVPEGRRFASDASEGAASTWAQHGSHESSARAVDDDERRLRARVKGWRREHERAEVRARPEFVEHEPHHREPAFLRSALRPFAPRHVEGERGRVLHVGVDAYPRYYAGPSA